MFACKSRSDGPNRLSELLVEALCSSAANAFQQQMRTRVDPMASSEWHPPGMGPGARRGRGQGAALAAGTPRWRDIRVCHAPSVLAQGAGSDGSGVTRRDRGGAAGDAVKCLVARGDEV